MNIPWGDYKEGFEEKQNRKKKKQTAEQLAKYKQTCERNRSKRKKK